ncbi:MAG: hypothetical protein WAN54_13790, partial [Syntrophobacteraceae bacterium]
MKVFFPLVENFFQPEFPRTIPASTTIGALIHRYKTLRFAVNRTARTPLTNSKESDKENIASAEAEWLLWRKLSWKDFARILSLQVFLQAVV